MSTKDKKGWLARLVIAVLIGTTSDSLRAEEPESAPPPPATSIREWRTTPSPTPAGSGADASATPATSIREWRATTATGAAAAPAGPARSIREWRNAPAPAPGPCPAATPIASMPATPVATPSSKQATGPTSPITISIKSTMRQGTLVVVLDDVAVFAEKFQKPLLVISQTSTWDPLLVPAGTHRLTAKVVGTKKTYISKSYDLHVSPTKGAALRFIMQGDKLTVALGS